MKMSGEYYTVNVNYSLRRNERRVHIDRLRADYPLLYKQAQERNSRTRADSIADQFRALNIPCEVNKTMDLDF